MVKKRRFSLRLLSAVIATLVFTAASWTSPSIDVDASIIHVMPFHFNFPENIEPD